MTEVWKPVPSAPFLLASSEGRIMVKPYEKATSLGGVRTYGGTPHFGTWDGERYVYYFRRTRTNYKVARLVCEAFHGPAPDGKPLVMHLDENSRNNRPENLSWGSSKENLNAPGYLDYCRSRVGDLSPVNKGRRKRAGTVMVQPGARG